MNTSNNEPCDINRSDLVNEEFNIIISNTDNLASTTPLSEHNFNSYINNPTDDEITNPDNEITSLVDKLIELNSEQINLLSVDETKSSKSSESESNKSSNYEDYDLSIYGKDTITCDFCKNKCNIL